MRRSAGRTIVEAFVPPSLSLKKQLLRHRLSLSRDKFPPIVVATVLLILACLNLGWALDDGEYRDFGSFWASGHASNAGDNPYGVYEHTFRVGSPEGPTAPNLNPPASIYPLRLLATVDIDLALQLWRWSSIVLFLVTLITLVMVQRVEKRLFFALWAFNLAGLWHTIELGQIYVPLLALVVAAWISLLQGRTLLAALFIGALAATKPNFLVWPALLTLGGEHKTGLRAFGVFGVVTAMPLLVDGPWMYEEWLRVTPSLSEAAGGMARIGGNSSLLALTGKFDLAPLGIVMAGLLAFLVVLIALLRAAAGMHLNALALVTTLLLGPVTWVGYTILLLPVFSWMRWTPGVVLAAASLCVPYWLVMEIEGMSPWRQWAESIYGATLIMMLFCLLLPPLRDLRLRTAGGSVRSAKSAPSGTTAPNAGLLRTLLAAQRIS